MTFNPSVSFSTPLGCQTPIDPRELQMGVPARITPSERGVRDV